VIKNTASLSIGDNKWNTNETRDPLGPKQALAETGGIQIGDTVEYEVTFANASANTAAITITDPIPAGTVFITGSNAFTLTDELGGALPIPVNPLFTVTDPDDRGGETIAWQFTNVPALARGSVRFTVTVTGKAFDGIDDIAVFDEVTNTAKIQLDNTPAVETNTTHTPVNEGRKFSDYNGKYVQSNTGEYARDAAGYYRPATDGDVSAQRYTLVNPGLAVGDTVRYAVNYKNTSGAPAPVWIEDTMPTDTFYSPDSWRWAVYNGGDTLVAGRDASGAISGDPSAERDAFVSQTTVTAPSQTSNKITVKFSGVPEGYRVVVYFNVTVADSAFNAQDPGALKEIRNRAKITVDSISRDTNEVVDPMGPKQSDVPVGGAAVGDEIEYFIVYHNDDDRPAKITISDIIPLGTVYEGKISQYGLYDLVTNAVGWDLGTVDPGVSGFVWFKVRVTRDALVAGEVSNTAKIKIGDRDPHNTNTVVDPVNNDLKSSDYEGKYGPEDSFGNKPLINPGVSTDDEITYTVRYFNDSGSTVGELVITDSIPEHTAFSGVESVTIGSAVYTGAAATAVMPPLYTFSGPPAGDHGRGVLTFTLGSHTLPDGAEFKAVFNVTVLASAIEKNITHIDNVARINIGNGQKVWHTNIVSDPIGPKSADKDESGVRPGEEIEYRVYFHNPNFTQSAMVLTDNIPLGTTYVIGSATIEGVPTVLEADSMAPEDVTTLVWREDVAGNRDGYVTFKVRVKSVSELSDLGISVIRNTAQIAYDGGNPVFTNEVDTPVNLNRKESDYAGKGTSDYMGLHKGDTVTYKIYYANTSTRALPVIIEDIVPEYTSYVAGTASPTTGFVYDGAMNKLRWEILSVPAGGEGYVSYNVVVNETVIDSGATEIRNTASVKLGEGEFIDTNEVVDPLAPKQSSGPTGGVTVGATLRYNISFENTLDTAATVRIEDYLPSDTEYAEAIDGPAELTAYFDADGEPVVKTAAITYDPLATQFVWVISDVQPGERGVVSFAVRVSESALIVSGNEIVNRAEIKVGDNGPIVDIVRDPVVQTNKTSSYEGKGDPNIVQGVSVGTEIKYAISWVNTTGAVASAVFYDAIPLHTSLLGLPGYVTVNSVQGARGVYYKAGDAGYVAANDTHHNGYIVWTAPSVAPNQAVACEFSVTVEPSALSAPSIRNKGRLVINNSVNLDTNETIDPVGPKQSSPLTPSGDAETDALFVGDTLRYTVRYVNTAEYGGAPGQAARIVISDIIPAGTAYKPGTAGASIGAEPTQLLFYDEADDLIGGEANITDAALVKRIEWIFGDTSAADPEDYVELVEYGSGGIMTFDVIITADAIGPGNPNAPYIDNTAQITVGENNPKQTNTTRDTALQQEKSSNYTGDEGLSVGDLIKYTITVRNNQASPADIIITDAMPEHTKFTKITIGMGNTSIVRDAYDNVTAVEARFPGVTAGGAVTIEYEVEVLPSAWEVDAITNTAQVKIGDRDPRDTNEVSDPMGPKKTSVSGAARGEPISYSIEREVTGEDAFETYTVWDALPQYTVYDPAPYDLADYPDLRFSGPASGTYTAPAQAASADRLEISFWKLKVSGPRVSPANMADLVQSYEPITGTDGPETVDLVMWAWTTQPAEAPFAEGTKFEARFTVKVSEDAPVSDTGIVNHGVIQIGDGQPHDTNTVTVPFGEKSSNYTGKDSGAMLAVGDKIDYEVIVKNTSGLTADITITDAIPEGTEYIPGTASADPATAAINPPSNTAGAAGFTWVFSNVPANDEVKVMFSVAVAESAVTDELDEITNKASYRIGRNRPRDTNTVHDPLGPKQTTVTGITPGGKIPYEIKLTPTQTDIAKFELSDEIPEYTVYDYADGAATRTPAGGITPKLEFFDEQNVLIATNTAITAAQADSVAKIVWTWERTDGQSFAPNTQFKAVFGVVVAADAPLTVVENTAQYIIGDDARDTNMVPTDILPEEKSSYYLDKAVGGGLSVGEEITYTVEYENKTARAQSVTIRDLIPYHTAYVAHSATYGAASVTDAADSDVYAYTPPSGTSRGYVQWSAMQVPAGETLSVSFKVWVLYSALEQGVTAIRNTATVEVDGRTHATNETIDPLGPKQSDVATNAYVGRDIEYTVRFEVTENMLGGGATTEVIITDDIPEYTRYVPGSATLLITDAGGATVVGVNGVAKPMTDMHTAPLDTAPDDEYHIDGYVLGDDSRRGTATWTLPGRSIGDVITVTFKAKVQPSALISASPPGPGVILNKAHIEFSDAPGFDTNTVRDPVEPDRKTSNAAVLHEGEGLVVGDIVRYEITWKNETTHSVKIIVRDAIPALTAYKTGSASTGGTYRYAGSAQYNPAYDKNGNGYVEWAEVDVAPDGEIRDLFDVVILKEAFEYAEIINGAVIVADGKDIDTNIVRDRMAEKQADAPVDGVSVGAEITYSVSFLTREDAAMVRVFDKIPAGTVYVDGSAEPDSPPSEGKYGFYDDDGKQTSGPLGVAGIVWEFYAEDYPDSIPGTIDGETVRLIPAGSLITVNFKVKTLPSALNLPQRMEYSAQVPASAVANAAYMFEFVYEQHLDGDGNPVLADNPDKNNTNVVITPVLRDEKKSNAGTVSPDGLIPGKTFTYTIHYENSRSETADIVVTDAAPAHTRYETGSATCQTLTPSSTGGRITLTDADDADGFVYNQAGQLVWTIRDVPPGGSGEVTFDVTVLPSAVTVDVITNTATIAIGDNDPHITNEVRDRMGQKQAHVVTDDPQADTGVTSVYIYDEIRYVVKFRNDTSDVVEVTVTDTIPSYTTYKDNTAKVTQLPPGASAPQTGAVDISGVVDGKGTIRWRIIGVQPGAEGYVEFTVSVDDDAPNNNIIRNKAQITYQRPGDVPPIVTDTNETQNPVLPKKVYRITDDVGPRGLSPGDTIRYEVTYTLPDSTMTNTLKVMAIIDRIPDYTTLVPGSITSNPSATNPGRQRTYTTGDGRPIDGGYWDYGIAPDDKSVYMRPGDKYIEWVFNGGSQFAMGTVITVSFAVTVNDDLPARHVIVNTAFIDGQKTNTPTVPDTGGGGPIDIPDEDPPLGLFTDDHFGYIIGYPDGTVRPQRDISRAEVTTVFFRMIRDEVRSDNWTRQNPFPDVGEEEWFNNAISVMTRMRVVQGYPNGTFQPNGSITRAELAAIIARFARQMEMEPLNDTEFSDISGHWAEEDIQYAAAIGWLRGYPDGTYRPNQSLTRAEFMTTMNRILERAPETEEDLIHEDEDARVNVWPDNADSSEWYYLDVQEATNSHNYEYKEIMVPGLGFFYETWVEMREMRDWAQFERAWSTANSAPNPGDVMAGGADSGLTGLPPGITMGDRK
jgi:uncharacterized repeat protein (TIGR01451 family)